MSIVMKFVFGMIALFTVSGLALASQLLQTNHTAEAMTVIEDGGGLVFSLLVLILVGYGIKFMVRTENGVFD